MKKDKEKIVPYNSEKKYEERKIGDIVIRLIPIEELKIAKTNVRVIHEEEGLEELSKNIEQLGLIHLPLATSDGKVYVGGRRLLAYKKAGKLLMPVRILDVSKKQQILLSLSENVRRNVRYSHLSEFVGVVSVLKEKYGMTNKEIATKLGIHPGTLGMYFTYQRMPEETEEEIKKTMKDEFGPRKANCIARFFKTPLMQKNWDKQREIVFFLKDLPDDYIDSYIIQANLNLPVLNQMEEMAVHPYIYKRLLVPLRAEMHQEMIQYAQEKHLTFSELISTALKHYIEEFPVPKIEEFPDIGPLKYQTQQDP